MGNSSTFFTRSPPPGKVAASPVAAPLIQADLGRVAAGGALRARRMLGTQPRVGSPSPRGLPPIGCRCRRPGLLTAGSPLPLHAPILCQHCLISPTMHPGAAAKRHSYVVASSGFVSACMRSRKGGICKLLQQGKGSESHRSMPGDVELAVPSGLQLRSEAAEEDGRLLGRSATVSGGHAQEDSRVVSVQAAAASSVAAAMQSPTVRDAGP